MDLTKLFDTDDMEDLECTGELDQELYELSPQGSLDIVLGVTIEAPEGIDENTVSEIVRAIAELVPGVKYAWVHNESEEMGLY